MQSVDNPMFKVAESKILKNIKTFRASESPMKGDRFSGDPDLKHKIRREMRK